jgi:hypothetical protein
MKKTTVKCLGLVQGYLKAVEVEGYEIEPGWVVHRSVGYSYPPGRPSWTVTHADSGRALLKHSPTRAWALQMFDKYKADGTIARALEKLADER